ncbi:hypothetical protein HETIRDRAFT_306975 [Heterobasidion irregulare TC 32-1]|uniref:Nop52-domain-containing protein n=1 Tax=Heterobasidion irregulare (strain TC 32-1) TaxID=747525 RepID=W4KMC0_HETIT|nr:uncharacterized protein HETIRDRAFT_306975 [Heterobasidion irregulare TC 32-1]ETW86988.1 hypothetical protein HETIRDRAFT_306975 [Heterobasidion irregulare TC 32-1]
MASASSSAAGIPPLGKYLASTDKKTRDKAIKSLAIFLSDSSRPPLRKNDMDKLWKGIFYCFWMSDKPLVQQALASELAEIILTIESTASSLAFLRGFWETTVREWNGIDRLRIDKYYMLIRRFANASFRLLVRCNWNSVWCEEYNDILAGPGGPLCVNDSRVPSSLAYHLADIYLEELDKAVASQLKLDESDDEPTPTPLVTVLSPFLSLSSRTISNTTYSRIQSAILDPLFQSLSTIRSDEPPSAKRRRVLEVDYASLLDNACMLDPKSEGKMERSPLRKALLRKLFDVASEQDTRDSNRRKLYSFWKSNQDEDDEEDRPIDAS